MNRRGFLQGILALGMAPAIVRADSLMRIVPREAVVLTDGMFVVTSVTESVVNGGRFACLNQITMEALRIAHGKMTFIGQFANNNHGLKVGDVITDHGYKVGDTVQIKLPDTWVAQTIR